MLKLRSVPLRLVAVCASATAAQVGADDLEDDVTFLEPVRVPKMFRALLSREVAARGRRGGRRAFG